MNNNQNPTDRLAAELLIALECDYDIIPMLECLRDLMTPPDFAATTLAIEFCPIHLCDAQICLDDDTHDPYL